MLPNFSTTWHHKTHGQIGRWDVYKNEALFLGALFAHGIKETQDHNWSRLEYEMHDHYFATQEGRIIWQKAKELRKQEIEIDIQTLAKELEKTHGRQLENETCVAVMPLFTDECGSWTLNPNHWAKLMVIDHINVCLKKAITEMDDNNNGADRVLKLYRALENIQKDQSQGFQIQKLYGMPELIDNFIDELEEKLQKKDDPNFDSRIALSGYPSLDEKVRFGPGHLVIIGGRASVGKTTAAMNIMRNMIHADKKLVFYSLEMSKEEILNNWVAMEGSVNYQALSKYDLNDDEQDRIIEAARRLYNKKAVIFDDGNQTIDQMTSRLHAAANKLGGIDAIFIDHMHIIRGEGKKTMRENMVDISARLKALAKEWSIPVIALAQMNRDADKRQDKRPQLSDLKESGSIEQDADTILFVYRDSLYQTDKVDMNKNDFSDEKEHNKDNGITEIICKKNRHGILPFFTVAMEVDGTTKRMTDPTARKDQDLQSE